MTVRPAAAADLAWIMPVEKRFHEEGFIGLDTVEGHLARMAEADSAYFLFEEYGASVAYAIFRGRQSPHRSIELKRVAVADPGRGLGRPVVRTLIDIAFTEFGAHRLWLDVFLENERARRLYRSLGFVEEGIQREAIQRSGRFYSQALMSILEHEYRPTK